MTAWPHNCPDDDYVFPGKDSVEFLRTLKQIDKISEANKQNIDEMLVEKPFHFVADYIVTCKDPFLLTAIALRINWMASMSDFVTISQQQDGDLPFPRGTFTAVMTCNELRTLAYIAYCRIDRFLLTDS